MSLTVVTDAFIDWIKLNPIGTLYLISGAIICGVINFNRKKLSDIVHSYSNQITNDYRDIKTTNEGLKTCLKSTDYEVRRFYELVGNVHKDVADFKVQINQNLNRITIEMENINKTGTRVTQVGMKLMELKKDLDAGIARLEPIEKNHEILLSSFNKIIKK